jgi:predicted ATP-dependent protease
MGIVWQDAKKNIRVSALHDGEGLLLCPQCKGNSCEEFMHIIQATVHRGEDKITVTSKNVSIDAEKNILRGTVIALEYEGECGHHGEIILHFYKGNTFIYHQPLRDIIGEDGHSLQYSEKGDIFRD